MNFIDKIKGKLRKGRMVVLAEKYSVAADYANTMGCTLKDGYFEGGEYLITWTNGHLCTLYDPEDYNDDYKVWKAEDLPIVPNGFWVKVRKERNKRTQLEIIKNLICREDVSSICIGTDSGREGNLIGEYVLKALKNTKPVYRLWINALTEKEILQGFKNIKPAEEYNNLTLAAQARDEIDWLIGYNFSRAYSLIDKQTHTVGRCKSVVLNLLCEREKLIKRFKPEDYYDLVVAFKSKNSEYTGTLISQVHVTSRKNIDKIKGDIEEGEGTVIDVKNEIVTVPPPSLFNLSDLARAMNRRFAYTVDQVYAAAQSLYENKLITYHRTDSRHIKTSMIDDMYEVLKCTNFGKFASIICDINNLDKFIKRNVDDTKVTDHTAIVPVKNDKFQEVYESLDTQTKRVMDEIILNTLAAAQDDYKYESISITTEVNGYLFITRQQRCLARGWKDVYKSDEASAGGIEVAKGDKAMVNAVTVVEKVTQAPERYTDDTLLAVLENPSKFIDDKKLKKLAREKGIGTSATRDKLIQDLIASDYAIRDKKHIVPTIRGQELIDKIEINELKEPYFTAEIEGKLQDISEGQYERDELIKEIMHFVRKGIEDLKRIIPEDKSTSRILGTCPICKKGRIVPAGDKGYGCTELKNSGCKFYISRFILGTQIDENQVKKVLIHGQTDMLDFKGPKGIFTARIKLEGNRTKFEYK